MQNEDYIQQILEGKVKISEKPEMDAFRAGDNIRKMTDTQQKSIIYNQRMNEFILQMKDIKYPDVNKYQQQMQEEYEKDPNINQILLKDKYIPKEYKIFIDLLQVTPKDKSQKQFIKLYFDRYSYEIAMLQKMSQQEIYGYQLMFDDFQYRVFTAYRKELLQLKKEYDEKHKSEEKPEKPEEQIEKDSKDSNDSKDQNDISIKKD